ncbi:MAG TPA: dienelactone hydrolase family protein [Rhodanobacteraceae bacterium]
MSTTPAPPVSIRTRDGNCRAFTFKPAGHGPWPAVIVYMDAFAIRPSLLQLGQRIADMGYLVLVPDLFYRSGAYATMDPTAYFSDPGKFKELKEKFMVHATVGNVMSDTRTFLDFLAQQPDVKPGRIGTTGYCMGGRFALGAAGTFPDRVGAAATFHGGNLAADDAESPHRLAPKMRAHVFVAGATGDNSFPDTMKTRLETALADAGVAHTVETWPAKHGWTFDDTPVYDATCYGRHLKVLQKLYADALGG